MINIIKTAIITIIISFISGLLLDHYRNLAPRILCNIGKGIPIDINNKKFNAYIITVRNISNKIIHDITLNVQSHQSNLKITDAKITKGLKFDYSIEDNILDVSIPFLSKDDEFSVTVYVENQHGVHNKPAVIIRSPEKFKEVNSEEKRGIFSIFTNIPKNIKEIISDVTKKDETINKGNREITNKNNKLGKNKKVMIIAASVVLVVIVGVVARFYFKGKPADTNTKTPSVETKIPKQSNDSKGSTDKTTKGTDIKSSTDGKTKIQMEIHQQVAELTIQIKSHQLVEQLAIQIRNRQPVIQVEMRIKSHQQVIQLEIRMEIHQKTEQAKQMEIHQIVEQPMMEIKIHQPVEEQLEIQMKNHQLVDKMEIQVTNLLICLCNKNKKFLYKHKNMNKN